MLEWTILDCSQIVTNTSMLSLMNFPSLAHINEISPRPILFIVGENAHSRPFTKEKNT